MSGAATNAQIAAFLTALRMKGETVEELIGFAQVMRQKVVQGPAGRRATCRATGTDREMLIDTCGTGGDASGTFNVSTATAFVVAGRRAEGGQARQPLDVRLTSLCGSADVVEALGVSLELTAAQVSRCMDEVGIGFLYAPLLHTAMKHVMPARREIGIRTVFNLLGPLTNPAGANAQVIGVAAADAHREARPRARRARHAARVRRPRRRRPRRDLEHRREPRRRGARGRGAELAVRPEDFGLARASHPATCRAGTARRTPRSSGAILAGDAGGPPRHRADERGGGAGRGRARARSQGGRGLAAESIDSGAAAGQARRPDRAVALADPGPPEADPRISGPAERGGVDPASDAPVH